MGKLQLDENGPNSLKQKIVTSKGTFTRILVGLEQNKEKAAQIANKLETEMKIKGNVVGNLK